MSLELFATYMRAKRSRQAKEARMKEARAALLADVKALPDAPPLGSEIAHYMSVDDREYAYDEVSALFDALALAEHETKDREIMGRARALLIKHGFYREMPADEIASTFRTKPGPVWDFKLGGIAYTTDYTVEEWQWPEGAAQ
jgi:hypothetical protein